MYQKITKDQIASSLTDISNHVEVFLNRQENFNNVLNNLSSEIISTEDLEDKFDELKNEFKDSIINELEILEENINYHDREEDITNFGEDMKETIKDEVDNFKTLCEDEEFKILLKELCQFNVYDLQNIKKKTDRRDNDGLTKSQRKREVEIMKIKELSLEGLSNRAIAKIIGCSEGKVRNLKEN